MKGMENNEVWTKLPPGRTEAESSRLAAWTEEKGPTEREFLEAALRTVKQGIPPSKGAK